MIETTISYNATCDKCYTTYSYEDYETLSSLMAAITADHWVISTNGRFIYCPDCAPTCERCQRLKPENATGWHERTEHYDSGDETYWICPDCYPKCVDDWRRHWERIEYYRNTHNIKSEITPGMWEKINKFHDTKHIAPPISWKITTEEYISQRIARNNLWKRDNDQQQ